MTFPQTTSQINPANRLGLDYRAQAASFRPLSFPIIDAHSHIRGDKATTLYRSVAELYGIGMTYSMSPLEELDSICDRMHGRIRFIAVPNYWAQGDDRKYEMTIAYIKRIEKYHAAGSRIAKFWCAPRSLDYGKEMGDPALMRMDAPHRIEAMQTAHDLGMVLMAHIADPDTWFATKYVDAEFYGTKAQQYETFESLLNRFDQPWIGAHFGGWPEDLAFLTGLLTRHPNLYLDTSATKWIVREISRHSRDDLLAFMRRFKGRLLFGSDIVTSDEHLTKGENQHEMYQKANTPDEAFDLYASRYWALRTLWETNHRDESPIADPDLAMVDPQRFDEMAAPQLVGQSLPDDLLKSLYHDAAMDLLEPYFD